MKATCRWTVVLMLIMAATIPLPSASAEENPFRDLLDEETYDRKVFEAGKEMSETYWRANSDVTPTGVQIDRIRDDGQAANTHLQIGDIIYRIGEQELWGKVPWHRTSEPQQFFSDSAARGKQSFWAEPGLIGVDYSTYNRPDVYYLQRKENRSEAWDEHVVAACLSSALDPDFAESAWHRAIEAGYPQDDLSWFYAAVLEVPLAVDEKNETATEKFLRYFPPEKTIPNVYLSALMTMLTDGDSLDRIAELCQQRSPGFPWTIGEIKRLQQWQGGQQSTPQALLARALASPRNDITRSLAVTTNNDRPRSGMSVVIRANPGQYQMYKLRPNSPLKNFHLNTKFKARSTGQHSRYGSAMRLVVTQTDESKSSAPSRTRRLYPHHDVRLVAVHLEKSKTGEAKMKFTSSGAEAEWGLWSRDVSIPYATEDQRKTPLGIPGKIEDRTGEPIYFPTDRDDEALVTEMDIVRIDNEVGVFLNGVPRLHMPVDPTIDDVFFYLHASGFMFERLKFSIHAIE